MVMLMLRENIKMEYLVSAPDVELKTFVYDKRADFDLYKVKFLIIP